MYTEGCSLFDRYRVSRPDLLRTLCWVRSAGHYIVKPKFHGDAHFKDFLQFFWCSNGTFFCEYGGKVVKLSSGDTFCYFPGDWHEIYSGDNECDYYWITIDGPDIPSLIRTFDLRREAVHAGPCPKELFTDILRMISEVEADAVHLTSLRAIEILSCAANRINVDADDSATDFRHLVAERFGSSDFSISSAARTLGIHRSTLHRLFVAQSGVTPQEYLKNYRLQRAVERLQHGAAVKSTADECGFAGQNYFTKVFRRRFGMPPASFRDAARQHAESDPLP